MTATDTKSRSRRGNVTAAATGEVIEPCSLVVTEGVLVVTVEVRNGLVTVAATDELNVDTLVGTAKQKKGNCCIYIYNNLCREFHISYSQF